MLGKYSKDTAPFAIYTLLSSGVQAMSAQEIADHLGMSYSTISSATLLMERNKDIRVAYRARDTDKPRATTTKFYTIVEPKPTRQPINFPWKINPKGYTNGYQAQPS